MRHSIIVSLLLIVALNHSSLHAAHPNKVVYEGKDGIGQGKHIVFIAGDHEYRGEETLPALARILAKNHGFKCSVFFTTDPETGDLKPGSSHISGLEALKDADLMVIFLRFQNFPNDQMQHFVDYINRGGPVIGLRTSTHSFMIKEGPYAKYSTYYKGEEYKDGFGRQILGETWAGHYGKNHQQSSLVVPTKEQSNHPIFKGVKNMHVQCGGYKAYPIEGSVHLAVGRILNGMKADADPDKTKEELPVVWTRTYKSESGKVGRVFTTTHGASEDILNPGFRRMLLNSCLWALNMESDIKPDSPIDFIGAYNPTTFKFEGHRKGVKPSDIADWNSPILVPSK
jgi:type 1 glutamine amidotransferase